jgi:hypothetical protein
MYRLFLFCTIILLSFFTRAQTSSYCGTTLSDDQLTWLRNFQNNYTGSDERSSTYNVPLKIHIVGTDEGTSYMSLAYLLSDVCLLNEQFSESGFFFYIFEDINYINETEYYQHDWDAGSDMMMGHSVPNVVNMFFVDDPAGNCGYYSYYGDAIAVAKSCATPGNSTIAHEVGHFFSLPHTFYGWEWGIPDPEDQEWVSGDNCNSAGDGFCDTSPDYLSYRWNCPGPEQTDPLGDTFYSDGTFYMSYSNDYCTSRFSEEQTAAMTANLTGPRNNMLDFTPPVYTDLDSVVLISPAQDSSNLYPNFTEFIWSTAEGATSYHLQISYSSSFSSIAKDVITSGTSYIATDLLDEKTYHWRVKPITPANTCEEYSEVRTFETGIHLFSSIEEQNNTNDFAIYPNPAQNGSTVIINYASDKSIVAVLEIRDVTGKLVIEKAQPLSANTNNISMVLPNLLEGIYFVSIGDGKQFERIKLMVIN